MENNREGGSLENPIEKQLEKTFYFCIGPIIFLFGGPGGGFGGPGGGFGGPGVVLELLKVVASHYCYRC